MRRFFMRIIHFGRNTQQVTFESKVAIAANRALPDTIDNFDSSSAITVLSHIFESAAVDRKRIRHISNDFDPAVYDDYRVIDALQKCINSDIRMQYIINKNSEYKGNRSRFVKLLKMHNVEIVTSSEKLNPLVVLGESGNVYRYETDPETQKHVVSFNWPIVGTKLIKYFDQHFSKATKAPLTNDDKVDL